LQLKGGFVQLAWVLLMNFEYYWEQLRTRWYRRRFVAEVGRMLNTPVIAPQANAGPTVLTMLHTRDVLAYLLAVKSFAAQVLPGRVIVIADPSLTRDDRSKLSSHVAGVEIYPAEDFRVPGVPTGGTWERLIAMTRFSAEEYVIQLDADTVAIGPLPDVMRCFRINQSFTIGTTDVQTKVPVSLSAEWARRLMAAMPRSHVQLLCESVVHEVAAEGNAAKLYVRGCSGFTGFAKGAISEADVVALSERMGQALGDRWKEWGTEQFSSNYLVANAQDSLVLPHPIYTTPNRLSPATCFVHFIGSQRYLDDQYRQALKSHLAGLYVSRQ
jgi:hypothetical protein